MVMQFDEHEVESGVPGPVFPSGWHRSRRTRPTVRSWRHAVRSLQLDKGGGARPASRRARRGERLEEHALKSDAVRRVPGRESEAAAGRSTRTSSATALSWRPRWGRRSCSPRRRNRRPGNTGGIEQRNDEPTGDAANDVAVRPGPALPAIRFEGSERVKF